ncbi:hypothetical protein A5738_15075 [Mycobacterium colombiense]|nr:hypothetical protein A5738_15075 [Mycobacterium colombiense]
MVGSVWVFGALIVGGGGGVACARARVRPPVIETVIETVMVVIHGWHMHSRIWHMHSRIWHMLADLRLWPGA